MTCATPRSEHTSRRHYGCPFSRTPRADDGRLVPAGLLACGSNASLPPSRPDGPGQWHLGRRSPLTVAGAAAAWRETLSTRVPFSPAATRLELRQRPSRSRSEASHARACQQADHIRVSIVRLRCPNSHARPSSDDVRLPCAAEVDRNATLTRYLQRALLGECRAERSRPEREKKNWSCHVSYCRLRMRRSRRAADLST